MCAWRWKIFSSIVLETHVNIASYEFTQQAKKKEKRKRKKERKTKLTRTPCLAADIYRRACVDRHATHGPWPDSEIKARKRKQGIEANESPVLYRSFVCGPLPSLAPAAAPPHLLVVGGIPVRVEHDQPISANEIESAATGLAAQHEDKVAALEEIMLGVCV